MVKIMFSLAVRVRTMQHLDPQGVLGLEAQRAVRRELRERQVVEEAAMGQSAVAEAEDSAGNMKAGAIPLRVVMTVQMDQLAGTAVREATEQRALAVYRRQQGRQMQMEALLLLLVVAVLAAVAGVAVARVEKEGRLEAVAEADREVEGRPQRPMDPEVVAAQAEEVGTEAPGGQVRSVEMGAQEELAGGRLKCSRWGSLI
jgi:hypothetical protein